jgi:hypothetical protein
MNKGMIDNIVAGIFLLIFSMIVIVAWFISDAINTAFIGAGISTVGTQGAVTAIGIWDLGFVVLFIFMGIVDIIGAFMVRSHPVFFIIAIIFTLVLGVIAPQLSNTYDSFVTAMGASVDNAFPSMGFIMRNLSFFLIVISVITSVVMYSKTRESPI